MITLTPLNQDDEIVFKAAVDLIALRFDGVEGRHTVGAAILTGNGQIVVAVNLYANCGFGPCAESVLLGKAISDGHSNFKTLATVGGPDRNFLPLPPCGNCRQLLLEYAPKVEVIMSINETLGKVSIKDLLPASYKMC